MSLTAYIRYDSQGRIVPGGPIVTKTKPAVGNWQVVTEGTSVTLVGQLRAFVKLDRYNKPLAGSLFLGKQQPATGKWLEVNASYTGGNMLPSNCIQFVVNTTFDTFFQFNAYSYVENYTYTVTWGDGTSDSGSSGDGGITPSHIYANPNASYTARICFSDASVINELDFPGFD